MNNIIQQTFAMIKPDAIERRITGIIISIIEKEKLDIIKLEMHQFYIGEIQSFYEEHKEKPFFEKLCKYMVSGPVIRMVLEAPYCIQRWRILMGPSDPKQAGLETIRGMYGIDMPQNTVHGSDSEEAAKREISLC